MSPKILIVDDDPQVVALVRPILEEASFEVVHAHDYHAGCLLAHSESPALFILDIVVPGGSGVDLCRKLRSEGITQPIIMLSSKSSEADRVLALELGADDYVVKPFSARELLARVRARLRSPAIQEPSVRPAQAELEFGDLRIDLNRKKVFKRGDHVELTATEYALLAHLARHSGTPLSREQLLNSIWGYDCEGYLHTVNTCVNRLRTKLEDNPARPRYVLTERGHGYRFVERQELV
jgi:DNA-binding response OmpR family regulator